MESEEEVEEEEKLFFFFLKKFTEEFWAISNFHQQDHEESSTLNLDATLSIFPMALPFLNIKNKTNKNSAS